MSKMVMIAYNEALDNEVMEVLDGCAAKNYTKITGAYGRGLASGTHLGNDIWPGRNNILYIACDEQQAERLFSGVRGLRNRLSREGIKAFMLPLEELT